MAPVNAEIARALAQARPKGGAQLGLEQVDIGVGEVGKAAGVVGVEVGDDDVTDIAGLEAERLDLGQRRFVEPRPGPVSLADGPSCFGLRASSVP